MIFRAVGFSSGNSRECQLSLELLCRRKEQHIKQSWEQTHPWGAGRPRGECQCKMTMLLWIILHWNSVKINFLINFAQLWIAVIPNEMWKLLVAIWGHWIQKICALGKHHNLKIHTSVFLHGNFTKVVQYHNNPHRINIKMFAIPHKRNCPVLQCSKPISTWINQRRQAFAPLTSHLWGFWGFVCFFFF